MTANRMVQVGDEQVRLEPFSGRKAIRVVRTIERITKGVPEILEEWARFTSAYEASTSPSSTGPPHGCTTRPCR
jgi:hypothetical protein